MPEFSGPIEITNWQDRDIESARIRYIVSHILADANFERGEVSIAVVDDSSIHDLNRKYLQHDYATDVLSFVLNCDQQSKMIEGEVIVSAETAFRVASELGHPFKDELMLYVVHGTLHLVGYRDSTVDEKSEMTVAESRYLNQLGIDDLLVDRDAANQPGAGPNPGRSSAGGRS